MHLLIGQESLIGSLELRSDRRLTRINHLVNTARKPACRVERAKEAADSSNSGRGDGAFFAWLSAARTLTFLAATARVSVGADDTLGMEIIEREYPRSAFE